MDIEVKYRRTKIFHKFCRVSPKQLADLINEAESRKGSGLRTNRMTVHQVVNGGMTMRWIRQALAEILGESVEELWPYRDKRGPYKPRKAA